MWLAPVILYIQSHPQQADPRPLEGGPAAQQLLMSRTPAPGLWAFPVPAPGGSGCCRWNQPKPTNPVRATGEAGLCSLQSAWGGGAVALWAHHRLPVSPPFGPRLRRTASPVWVCHPSLVPTLLSPHPWAPNLRSPPAPPSTPLARQQGKPTALVPGGGGWGWMPLCHPLPVTSGKGTTSVIVLRRAVLARLSPKHSRLRAGTWRVSADQGRCLQTGNASPTACLLILEARAFPLPLEAFTPATESVPTAVPDTTWAGWSWKWPYTPCGRASAAPRLTPAQAESAAPRSNDLRRCGGPVPLMGRLWQEGAAESPQEASPG